MEGIMRSAAVSNNDHQLAQLRVLASFEKDPAKRLALLTEINLLLQKIATQKRSLRTIQLKKTA
jgi:hypothetical protein